MYKSLTALLILAAGTAHAELPPFDGEAVEECIAGISTSDGAVYQQCIGLGSQACLGSSDGTSTAGTVSCLVQETDYWSGKMEGVYDVALAEAGALDEEMAKLESSAPSMSDALEAAQTGWKQFMTSTCDLAAAQFGGGSGAGPAAQACAVQLTAEQYFRLLPYASTGQ